MGIGTVISAPLAVVVSLFGRQALVDLSKQLIVGFAGSLAANQLTSGSDDICGCLAGIDKILREIDATLKDGFSGRNIDLEGTRRRLNRAGADKLFTEGAIATAEAELGKLRRSSGGFSSLGQEIREQEKILAALNVQAGVLEGLASHLEAEKARLEALPEGAPGGFNPTTVSELNTLLNDLTTAIGGEEGLSQAFLELDAALQSANLPAELENLADAMAAAAARIANTPGGTTNGKASGGTVQPGQPVLVGERGPEIFVPGAAGSIVNAFDGRTRGRIGRQMRLAA